MDQEPIQPPPIAAPPAPPVATSSEPENKPAPLPGIPFPPFVVSLAAVTLIAFALGVAQLPGALRQGINYERAQRQIKGGHSATAIPLLASIVKEYPDASEARLDLAEAYMAQGDFAECAKQVITFEGKEVSREEESRLNVLDQQLNDAAKKLEAEEAKDKP